MDAPPRIPEPVQNLQWRSGRDPNESRRDRLSMLARRSVSPLSVCARRASSDHSIRDPKPRSAPGIHKPPSPPTAVAPSGTTAPKPAATPSTAPTGLVHKSAGYWSQYKSDIIRQIFDGGFGEDIDEDGQFHALFTGYVEQFSDSCRAYVPSPFEKETITHTVDGQPVSSREIDVDMRFWPKYHEFTNLGGFSAKSINTRHRCRHRQDQPQHLS